MEQCPQCECEDVYFSRSRSMLEAGLRWLGIPTLRCHRCHHRFHIRLWRLEDHRYARCPDCAGSTLRRWESSRDSASGWSRLMVRMGANPYRCERCRLNFASIRPRMDRDQALEMVKKQRSLQNRKRSSQRKSLPEREHVEV